MGPLLRHRRGGRGGGRVRRDRPARRPGWSRSARSRRPPCCTRAGGAGWWAATDPRAICVRGGAGADLRGRHVRGHLGQLSAVRAEPAGLPGAAAAPGGTGGRRGQPDPGGRRAAPGGLPGVRADPARPDLRGVGGDRGLARHLDQPGGRAEPGAGRADRRTPGELVPRWPGCPARRAWRPSGNAWPARSTTPWPRASPASSRCCRRPIRSWRTSGWRWPCVPRGRIWPSPAR